MTIIFAKRKKTPSNLSINPCLECLSKKNGIAKDISAMTVQMMRKILRRDELKRRLDGTAIAREARKAGNEMSAMQNQSRESKK